jgi:HK97 family phage major capsid protein
MATKPDPVEVEQSRLLPGSLDDLRGKTPDELRKILEVTDAYIRSLDETEDGELRDMSDDDETAVEELLEIRDAIMKRIERHQRLAEITRTKPAQVQTALTNIRLGALDGQYADVSRLTHGEARTQALRQLDDREATMHLRDDEKDQVARMLRANPVIARRIIVTENDAYRSMWQKMMTDPNGGAALDDEERQALRRWNEFRAMGEITTTAGGFGIPVFIDPSIILTAQGSGNPFLQIAKQVDINTNIWKGVTSAGVTWAFQTEAATTTDNSPVLAQPTVTVHMARGFIPYSIEVGMDYPGFANEMAGLLAAGYNELLIDKFTRGTGTGEPKGILTAISATSADRVKVAVGGSITAPDPYAVWKALPQRYRSAGKAEWLMSVGVNNAIRQIGAANVFHGYTVNLPTEWADQLFNAPVYESPYMPDTTTWTTTAEVACIVGDFQNFLIARNGGMSTELIPTLVQQVTAGSGPATPTAQRGIFAYARIGSDAINTAGFRALVFNT